LPARTSSSLNIASTGIVTEDCQAESGSHLKQLLTEDHRFIFTLIQKFGTKKGETYPELSTRDNIIVMTDEAHRSQYDTLALNMRNALPNAAFIGFTGTPLMAGEEKTKEVFGDYVSIYNFQQSIEDGATVRQYAHAGQYDSRDLESVIAWVNRRRRSKGWPALGESFPSTDLLNQEPHQKLDLPTTLAGGYDPLTCEYS